jgi:hypothetical protein
MLNHETMTEYYHLLHLSNGTILDLPAGSTAFLTEPTPTTFSSEPVKTAGELEAEEDERDPERRFITYTFPEPEVKTPETRILSLRSPKNMTLVKDEEPDMFRGPHVAQGPSCVSDIIKGAEVQVLLLTYPGLLQQGRVLHHHDPECHPNRHR